MQYLFVGFLGFAVGSFLNSVLFRMEKGKSAFIGRSSCPQCNHALAWYDLIPVVSFLLLRGKCRYCKQKISLQHPLVELATGIMFLAVFNLAELSLQENLARLSFLRLSFLAYLWVVASLLIAIFVYDLKHYIIPDKIVYPAIAVSGIWYAVFSELPKYQILNTIYSALGAAAFFLAIYLVSKGRWMGFGDIKLALLMGLFLGWPHILVALFFAFFLGALVGVFLVLSNKKKWKSQVPFGPFLITGTFIALFWGQSIIDWYLRFVLV